MLSACGSKPEFELVEQDPKIRIQFEMLNDGQSVDIGDRFVDQNEFNLQLKTMRFYISDLRLVGNDGEQELSEVELVNFNELQDGQVNPFVQGYDFIVKKDVFNELIFAIGLDAEMNSTDPTILPKDNPLSANSQMYWDWGSKYIFIMLEAGIDLDKDGVMDDDIGFHTGLDEQYFGLQDKTISLALDAFEKDTITVSIDWNKLFPTTGANAIDLDQAPYYHANADQEARDMTRLFAENFIGAIDIK